MSRTFQLSLGDQFPAAAAAADAVTTVVGMYNSLMWPVQRLHFAQRAPSITRIRRRCQGNYKALSTAITRSSA